MSEKASFGLLKVLAVVSALGLGAGYVFWKDAQAKDVRIEALEKRVAEWEETEEDVTLFVGSKSPGRDVLNFEDLGRDFEEAGISGTADQPPLMPGSKSGRILIPDTEEEKAVQQLLIPGSKSGLIIPPPLPIEETKEEEIQVLPGSKSLAPIFRQRKVEVNEP